MITFPSFLVTMTLALVSLVRWISETPSRCGRYFERRESRRAMRLIRLLRRVFSWSTLIRMLRLVFITLPHKFERLAFRGMLWVLLVLGAIVLGRIAFPDQSCKARMILEVIAHSLANFEATDPRLYRE